MNLESVRSDVAAACRELAGAGLVTGSAGNVSVRVGELAAVTATGARFAAMTADDVTVVDLPDRAQGDLTDQAAAVGAAADAVQGRTGARSVDVVGYSAGGVVARLWVAEGDGGGRGGLDPSALFVVAGDQNSDPLDGDSLRDAAGNPIAIQPLLNSPRVNDKTTPSSAGAAEATALSWLSTESTSVSSSTASPKLPVTVTTGEPGKSSAANSISALLLALGETFTVRVAYSGAPGLAVAELFTAVQVIERVEELRFCA